MPPMCRQLSQSGTVLYSYFPLLHENSAISGGLSHMAHPLAQMKFAFLDTFLYTGLGAGIHGRSHKWIYGRRGGGGRDG